MLIKNLYSFNSGTPSQETWPGVSSNDEFKNYNFPKYKPQPLINHAPRYFFLSERGKALGTHQTQKMNLHCGGHDRG